jgi:probable F420-dependent oxidoreductase
MLEVDSEPVETCSPQELRDMARADRRPATERCALRTRASKGGARVDEIPSVVCSHPLSFSSSQRACRAAAVHQAHGRLPPTLREQADEAEPMKITTKIPGMTLYPGTGRHWWQSITSEQLVTVTRRCEELGFDSIGIPYHLAMNSDYVEEMGPRWVHSLTAAGFVLGATSRIKVVPLVVVPYHNPIELAKALSTLDYVSGGRLIPQLLVGYNKWEFELLSAPFDARGEVMDEYVEAMRELWTSGRASYHGKHVSFDDVYFDPKPLQSPLPLWFGGRTKAALRRIARLGDGWISYATPRSQFAEMARYIREQPAFLERPRPLELWLELFEGRRDPDSHAVIEQAKIVREKEAIVGQLREIASVGATMTSLDDIVGIGKFQNGEADAPPPARDFNDHLERLQWVAEEILPVAREIIPAEPGALTDSLGAEVPA